jgi:hypothetical protein
MNRSEDESIKIGEVLRYPKPATPAKKVLDGCRNFYHVTSMQGVPVVQIESGISRVAQVRTAEGHRRPAVLIRSSPHKVGSLETPWLDTFDTDNGHIRYYGDSKRAGSSPMSSPGNKLLLSLYNAHSSPEKAIRRLAVPLLFYRGIRVDSRSKGFVQFHGFGLIKGIELVVQYNRKTKESFPNFAFDFHVFSLAADNEVFDWRWINDRRNASLTLDQTLRFAPQSWLTWLNDGPRALERVRRRVSLLMTVHREAQKPSNGSKELGALNEIHRFFSTKRHRFEAFAAAIAERHFRDWVGSYSPGWITPSAGDGGADFYGKITIGTGFGAARLIVLGQAKCEDPQASTGGVHIARTVARLKRGWLGVYVTTGWFSEPVQQEIIEDEYPIVLINGAKLADLALKLCQESGYQQLTDLLAHVDAQYDQLVKVRRPEELLIE